MSASFTLLDWSIVVLMLVAMMLIGAFSSKSNNTSSEFMTGGKHQKTGIVGLSLFATMMSALSYLSCPGETIKNGPFFIAGILSYPISGWVVGKFLIPRFCKFNVASGYQLLEIELGRNTRLLASLFFILLRMLWMSTILYATVSIAILPILGIDTSWAAIISLCIIAVTVLYTSLGGMNAVLKTDALQSVVMFLGAIVTIVIIVVSLIPYETNIGMVTNHWPPIEWKPSISTRMTLINLILMELCWQISTAGSDQMAIQRYLSVKGSKEAAHSYYISLASSALIKILLTIVGLLVLLYFSFVPSTLPEGMDVITDADALFPYFIRAGLPAGVTGLIAAALMAAAMSSISSGLLSVSTVIHEDFRRSKSNSHQISSVKRIRNISFVVGLIVALSYFFVASIPGNLYDLMMKVVNLVVSPLFVLFFAALFIKGCTDNAAVIGGVASLIVALLVAFVFTEQISPLWVMPMSLIAGVVISYLTSIFQNQFAR